MSEAPPTRSGAPSGYVYAGSELELFAHAVRWKTYLRGQLAGYLQGAVLEVGAGVGATTRFLCDGRQSRWVCLEPDPALAARIDLRTLPPGCEVRQGTIQRLAADEQFDAVLYVDVLEHIENDRAELVEACAYLRPAGRLIVLAPAYPWLFSAFDRSIGHLRRYTRKTLRALAPEDLILERWRYLDSVGLLASLANRLALGQQLPTLRQILLWDRVLIPLSRLVDPLLFWSFGRSGLGIWRRSPRS